MNTCKRKACGKPTSNKSYCSRSCCGKDLIEKWNVANPEVHSENGRSLFAKSGKLAIEQFRKGNPEFYTELMKSWNSKNPNQGTRALTKYLAENRDLRSSQAREHMKRWNSQNPDLHREIGLRNVKSGQIREAQDQARKNKRLPHLDHWHDSRPELKECIRILSEHPSSWVHPQVWFRNRRIDWVIADPKIFKPDDPLTWQKLIEYHQVRYWDGEIKEDYIWERPRELRLRGINRSIEIITLDRQGRHTVQLSGVQP